MGHNAARMCGRFALFTPPARIARYFEASLAEGADGEHAPSWNVAPTDSVLGVRDRPARLPEQNPQQQGPAEERGEPERILMSFRWGLIPWWSKDAKSGSRLFNARSETVATRASFREAFRSGASSSPPTASTNGARRRPAADNRTTSAAPTASRWPSPAWPSAGATRTRRRTRP